MEIRSKKYYELYSLLIGISAPKMDLIGSLWNRRHSKEKIIYRFKKSTGIAWVVTEISSIKILAKRDENHNGESKILSQKKQWKWEFFRELQSHRSPSSEGVVGSDFTGLDRIYKIFEIFGNLTWKFPILVFFQYDTSILSFSELTWSCAHRFYSVKMCFIFFQNRMWNSVILVFFLS